MEPLSNKHHSLPHLDLYNHHTQYGRNGKSEEKKRVCCSFSPPNSMNTQACKESRQANSCTDKRARFFGLRLHFMTERSRCFLLFFFSLSFQRLTAGWFVEDELHRRLLRWRLQTALVDVLNLLWRPLHRPHQQWWHSTAKPHVVTSLTLPGQSHINKKQKSMRTFADPSLCALSSNGLEWPVQPCKWRMTSAAATTTVPRVLWHAIWTGKRLSFWKPKYWMRHAILAISTTLLPFSR